MNFIVINNTIDQTREDLTGEKRLLTRVVNDTQKEEYRIRLANVESKLHALDRYEENQNKISEHAKLYKYRDLAPGLYNDNCKLLCKDIKGVSYDAKKEGFVVRKGIGGVKHYGGIFDHLDDALQALEYLLTKQKLQSSEED